MYVDQYTYHASIAKKPAIAGLVDLGTTSASLMSTTPPYNPMLTIAPTERYLNSAHLAYKKRGNGRPTGAATGPGSGRVSPVVRSKVA